MVITSQTRKFGGAILAAAFAGALYAIDPALLGVTALAGLSLATVSPGGSLRFGIVAILAAWAMLVAMFGLSGAGCFILAQIVVAAWARTIVTVLRPMDAILVSCAIAACGAPLLAVALGESGSVTGTLVAILMLAAPGFVLQYLTAGLRGRSRPDPVLQASLTPFLVCLVLAGGAAGLAGAAALFVIFMLAMPLISLMAPGPGSRLRQPLAAHAMGVMAAAFVACLATTVAIGFAGSRFAAMGPAVAVGLISGFIALRVHAPAALDRLNANRSNAPAAVQAGHAAQRW